LRPPQAGASGGAPVRRAALAGVLPRPRPHQLPELQAYAGMPYPAGLTADLSGGARNADPEADPHRDPQRPVLKPAAASAGANTTQKEPCPDGQGFFAACGKKPRLAAGLLVYSAQFSSSSS